MLENSENANTIIGAFTPLFPSLLTKVYPMPAPRPPKSPIRAGKICVLAPVGLIINMAPIKAVTVHAISNLEGISFKMNMEMSETSAITIALELKGYIKKIYDDLYVL